MGHFNDMFTILLIILNLDSPSQSSFTYIEKKWAAYSSKIYPLCFTEERK